MSDIWRAGLAPHLNPTSPAASKIHLLDIVEQAYQRPDAHRFPPEDCLHWCLPSVLGEFEIERKRGDMWSRRDRRDTDKDSGIATADDWNWTWWHLLSASEEVALEGGEK